MIAPPKIAAICLKPGSIHTPSKAYHFSSASIPLEFSGEIVCEAHFIGILMKESPLNWVIFSSPTYTKKSNQPGGWPLRGLLIAHCFDSFQVAKKVQHPLCLDDTRRDPEWSCAAARKGGLPVGSTCQKPRGNQEVGAFGSVYKWWLCFWILLFLWVLGFWHMVTSKNHNHSQEVTNLKPFGAVNQCWNWYNW